ncbi:MAG: CapA family protein, partial [Anaerolineales bacterium]
MNVYGEMGVRRYLIICISMIVLGGAACRLSTAPSNDPLLEATLTPIQPASQPTDLPLETPTNHPTLIYIENGLPAGFREQFKPPENVIVVDNQQTNAFQLGTVTPEKAVSLWVYALVAPFPTIEDEVSLSDLKLFWQGKSTGLFEGKPLLLTHNTQQVFSALWGMPAVTSVQELTDNLLLEYAWQNRPAWAIIPFEQVEPRWKVLRVNGISPFDRDFNPTQYPLTIPIGWVNNRNPEGFCLPSGNFDPTKMTTLVLTGTTALVRATGAKMEKLGMDYPARDIGTWLRDADLTHISNEVAFEENCPPANPYQTSLIFCSRPEYIELLEVVGTDIVELTGNHLMDWRRKALLDTIELYDQRGMKHYGA